MKIGLQIGLSDLIRRDASRHMNDVDWVVSMLQTVLG